MMRLDFWRRERRETDLEDEIAYDLALDAEERIRSGITRQEAERASRRDFGNVLLLKEGIREMWRSEEHTSELQSLAYIVCRLLLEKKNKTVTDHISRCITEII